MHNDLNEEIGKKIVYFIYLKYKKKLVITVVNVP